MRFLRYCDLIYRGLVDLTMRIRRRGDQELLLNWVQMAARLGWMAHPGRYSDGAIENLALEVGQKIEGVPPDAQIGGRDFRFPKGHRSRPRHILHVATGVGRVGGHSRLIDNWIRTDTESCHSLALTNMEASSIPEWLIDSIRRSGGSAAAPPLNAPLVAKARWLRSIARSGPDAVILHQDPNDVVPVVAFATPECPPLAIMNHADQVFWLGSSIGDAVINFRGFGERISVARRSARHTLMLPIPLGVGSASPDRRVARARLGIAHDQVVLLTIGGAFKYRPTPRHNFFRTLTKVLDRNPLAHLYIIGAERGEFPGVVEARHARFHFLGVINHPLDYKAAADLYIEGFPWGSLTALLESAASGLCPVLLFDPYPQIAVSEVAGLSGIVDNSPNERTYIELVSSLIDDAKERAALSHRVQRNVLKHHTGDPWRERVASVYSFLENHRHEPGPIPLGACAETEDDLNLSGFIRFVNREPLVLQVCQQAPFRLAVRDVLRLLYLSLRIGDARLSARFARDWERLLQRAFRNGLRNALLTVAKRA